MEASFGLEAPAATELQDPRFDALHFHSCFLLWVTAVCFVNANPRSSPDVDGHIIVHRPGHRIHSVLKTRGECPDPRSSFGPCLFGIED